MRLVIVAGLLFAGAGAPAIAAQGAQPAKLIVVTGNSNQDGDKIVCKKTKTTETGSRLRGRGKTCMRAFEWAEVDRATEAFKQGLIDRPPHAADAGMIKSGEGGGGPE